MPKTKIPLEIFRELEEIRVKGKYNMMNRKGVMEEAQKNNAYDLYEWIAENKEEYINGIINGFEVEVDKK